MNGREESDGRAVPAKLPNKADNHAAEAAEGRRPAKGNADVPDTRSTQGEISVPSGLDRVREAAKGNRKLRFTALLHHVTPELLRTAFHAIKRDAAAGADGVRWRDYEKNLEANLKSLLSRVHRGAYRPAPSRRTYIPKVDGRQRPLGVASVEDKILQGALARVLNAIYEVDFADFSYGFRPGRGCHMALDAAAAGITTKKVNWVLDADIRGFFDNLDHEILMNFLERRIADQRILRLIRKWLKAGVLEDGVVTEPEKGTPQGATISPLLANVYLHYALDTWTHGWRQRHARGDVIIVRYADDFIIGLQHRGDAERYLVDLRARFATVALELHPDKTRLIEFGRFAAPNRAARGEGKPESFDFLGFTHLCGKTKKGGFLILRRTVAKRRRAKLQAIKLTLRKRRHDTVTQVGAWLRQVLTGYYRYFAVPTNLETLRGFRSAVRQLWKQVLRRRSQRSGTTREQWHKLLDRWLPVPRALHPLPQLRFDARTQGKSPVR